ncbi:MAG: PspC domain-containing protein [Candidatus Hydrogenedentes bacterium]|nr:PspC domain-containing protein [Candidatus Hydrogenedentota bacterium]
MSSTEHKTGPYRSRNGRIFGVCRGLAEYFDFSVVWMRILWIGGLFITGIWPAGVAYIVLALVLKPEPVLPLCTEDDAEFYNSYTSSRSMALMRLKRTYENLDRRIQRIESIVTAKDYDWDRRLKEEK